MKKKILLEITAVLITAGMLFMLTGCGNDNQNIQIANDVNELADSHLTSKGNTSNDQNNTVNIPVGNTEQNQSSGYWYMNKTLTLNSGASNNGAHVTFSSPNSKGAPTKVSISGAYKLDGHSIDGTYSLSVTECSDEAVYGQMSGNADENIVGLMASTLKGQLSDGTGKILMVDIYF